jgi:tryptophan-rich sensory protein
VKLVQGEQMSSLRQILALIVFLVITFSAAGVGSLATTSNIPNWYAGLAKPSWTPPSWIFGPVWTLLYISMATAAWLVWRQGGLCQWPVALFAVQLALNAAWSWLFFGYHAPGTAFIEIIVLFAAISATTIAFWGHSLTGDGLGHIVDTAVLCKPNTDSAGQDEAALDMPLSSQSGGVCLGLFDRLDLLG